MCSVLPWLDDEQASLHFGIALVFTMMDGTTTALQTKGRRLEFLLMSSSKVQRPVRKTRRSKGRIADFCVIDLTPTAEHPADFHTRDELTAKQRENCRTLLCDEYPELLQQVDSPHVSRQ
jgi:predicted acylesterase/phospholipase RssA